MKVLVTGAGGFIGGHLFERLRLDTAVTKLVGVSRKVGRYPAELDMTGIGSAYFTFSELVNCDLTLESQVASLMLRLKPDVVFHLAGDPLVKNWGPGVTISTVLTTHHLLTYAPEGCRFVFASSATVYGNVAGRGDYVPEEAPTCPNSAYGAAKLGAEHLIDAFTRAGKVNGLSLRLAATVGSGANHGLVPDLVQKLRSDWPTLDLLGNLPGSVKPFTHVSDVVEGFLVLGKQGGPNGSLNLCNSDAISVSEAARAAMVVTGIQKPFSWSGKLGTWLGDNPVVRVDASRATRWGWEPKQETSYGAVAQAVRDIIGTSLAA